jgi:hypothetical protein
MLIELDICHFKALYSQNFLRVYFYHQRSSVEELKVFVFIQNYLFCPGTRFSEYSYASKLKQTINQFTSLY